MHTFSSGLLTSLIDFLIIFFKIQSNIVAGDKNIYLYTIQIWAFGTPSRRQME